MHSIPVREREWIPCGTTANEQLHRELNVIFDNVHEIHRPMLELKLAVFQMYKLFPHNRALLNAAMRQRSQSMLLNQIVHTLHPWTPEIWKVWCDSMCSEGWVGTAVLPAARKKTADAKRVRTWRGARAPAKKKFTRTVKKRTPFTKLTGLRDLRHKHRQAKRRQIASRPGKNQADSVKRSDDRE